jgi:hypothetical protein
LSFLSLYALVPEKSFKLKLKKALYGTMETMEKKLTFVLVKKKQ